MNVWKLYSAGCMLLHVESMFSTFLEPWPKPFRNNWEKLFFHLLGYTIKALLHTHKGAQRDNGRRGSPDNTLATPRPVPGATSSSKACVPKPRGAQAHKGTWKLKLRTQGINDISKPLPGEPQLQSAGVKPIIKSHQDHLSRWPYGCRRVSDWWRDMWDAG